MQKGLVCANRMINTGPTNNKIYHRCVDIITLFSGAPTARATEALLRSIYKVGG